MEKNAYNTWGVAFTAEERMCGTSDCLKTVFCKCGQKAVGSINSGYSCRLCGSDAEFGRVKTTYGMRMLSHFITGVGYRLAFDFKVTDKGLQELQNRSVSIPTSIVYETEREGPQGDEPEEEESEEEELDVEEFLDE
jgi:hypothetical protein